MGYIKGLGYVGVSGEDLDAWRQFGSGVLGLQLADADASADVDVVRFRMDSRSYRLAVHRGTDGDLRYLGFEIGTEQELAEYAAHLQALGVEVLEEGPEVCAQRRVAALRSASDPMGNRIEFFVGHEESTAPFVSPTGASFVIDDMGIGHVFVTCNDIDAFVEFYIDKLGFRLSDTVALMPGRNTYFVHCNPRHHTLACAAIPGMAPTLNHIMFQVESIDTVGRACDTGRAALDLTLGKHTNDHMISCFFKTPSGFNIEYGIDGRRVDDGTWVVGHYTDKSYWGHARPSVDA